MGYCEACGDWVDDDEPDGLCDDCYLLEDEDDWDDDDDDWD